MFCPQIFWASFVSSGQSESWFYYSTLYGNDTAPHHSPIPYLSIIVFYYMFVKTKHILILFDAYTQHTYIFCLDLYRSICSLVTQLATSKDVENSAK